MTFGPKKLGCCLACGKEVYQVLGYFTEGPLDGHPNRVGPMLTADKIEVPDQQAVGVQVEFLLSDGTEADVAFCRDCAAALTPADYYPAWEACIARGMLGFEIERRPRGEMLRAMVPTAQLWPVAVMLWRKEAPEINKLVLARKTEAGGDTD